MATLARPSSLCVELLQLMLVTVQKRTQALYLILEGRHPHDLLQILAVSHNSFVCVMGFHS